MSRLSQWVRDSYVRLSPGEQHKVLAIGAAAAVVLAIGLHLGLTGAIASTRERVETMRGQMHQVNDEAPGYLERQMKRERDRLRPPIELIPLVEKAARQSGVQILGLSPDESAPKDGIFEVRVDLKARGLSADRLQAFLRALEDTEGVVVARVSATRPHREDGLVIEATLKTLHREVP